MIRLPLLLAALSVASPPLIQVNDIALSGEAISRRAATLRDDGRAFPPEQLVEALVDEAALATEARRVGLDRDPGVRAAAEQDSARVLADAFVQGPLTESVGTSEADLRALYHQGSDMARLDVVMVVTEGEAQQVKARLEAGGEFALEAARSVDTRSGRNKGDTGPLNRIQMDPALAKVAFEAPLGKLFGPVALTTGFAVGRVTERRIADEGGFEPRRKGLEEFARKQGLSQAKKHYLEVLRKKHAATVDTAFIQTLGKRTDATPVELDRAVATVAGAPIPYRVLLPRVRAMGGGHLQGAATKTQLAWATVDERLLAKAAREAGLATKPQVAIDLAAAEVQALAVGMAERIRASQPAKASAEEREQAIRDRIKALRRELSIKVDRKAALAAAGTQR